MTVTVDGFTSNISAADKFTYITLPTTTALASSANPSPAGQPVTFTATVSIAAVTGVVGQKVGTAPTGDVTFRDGLDGAGTALATVTLSGTTASFTTSSLSTGSHSITATYNGDTNFNASTSTALNQVISQSAPTVTSISPSSGPLAGGTSVTITGTNFTEATLAVTINGTGATAVTFGGSAATGVTVVNSTTITATTPAHAAGAVDVVVTTPGGTGTGMGLYTYGTPAPTVTAVSPNTGPVAGGTSVTITGTNLTGATAVTFGGTAATGITVVNATTITATTPAHAAGVVDVAVTTPGGTGTGTGLYTYGSPAPTVTAVSPNTGPAAGGTGVTITGTNLTGATAVTFGGSAATGVTVVNSTTITATTPAHAAGAVDVAVTTPGGTGTGMGLYSYGTPAPTVTAVSPNTGPAAGGTGVTITGTNLTGATAVTFGGTAATGITVVNATTITATTPAHVAGAVDVAVTTPGGSGTGMGLYTYAIPAPTVTNVNPNKGPTTGGTSVTITGSNLTGATSVKFGSTNAASFTVNSATSITATSPAAALGTVDITVTTPAGTSATSAADQFTYAVPADSLKLHALQIAVTPLIAQISGQAITGAIDSAIDDGFSDNPQSFTPNGSGFTFNFGAEGNESNKAAASNDVRDFIAAPDRRASRIDDAFSALAYSGKTTKAPPRLSAPQRLTAPQRDWLGWIDVRGTSFDRSSVGNDLRGDQINASAGLTRKLTPDFLVGGFGGYEHFDFTSDALTGRLKGDGWTLGSYLGWRLAQSLRFDLALARSGIDFNGTAGTASATFPGSRWLASGGLTGTYRWQALVLQPSARIYALWEHENGYTDNLGTVQPDRNFSTGRASAGAKLIYPFAWTSTISLAPYAGVYGDYYFTGDDATSTGLASTALLQGWSARFTSGLGMKFQGGGMISAGGELGGIGGNTRIWTWRARGSVPF